MNALIVVESIFGNTRTIADAVAAGLTSRMEVQVVDVMDAPASVSGADLLVVGGPTHAFGMTRLSTRKSAAEQSGGTVVAAERGLREWLDALGHGTASAAAFDTRVDRPRLPGSAAAKAAKRLRREGYHVIGRTESFRVDGTTGPLLPGETDRARAWGEALAAQLAGPEPADRLR